MKKKVLSLILAIAMVISMFAGLATTASAATYSKVSGSLADGNYVMLLNVSDVTYAVSTYSSKWLQKTSEGFEIDTSVTPNTVTTTATNIVWAIECVDASNGYYTIKNTSDQTFLKWTASTNGIAAVTTADANCNWTLTSNTDGQYTIKSTDGTVRLANNGTSGLRAYKTTTTGTNYTDLFDLYQTADACAHTDTRTEKTDPTCTQDGVETVICNICEAEISKTVIPALGHAVETWEILQEASCTTVGSKSGSCTRCGETVAEEIAATGHNYVDGVCQNCGDTVAVCPVVTSLTVGDKIVLACKAQGVVLNGISDANIGTKAGAEFSGDSIIANDAALVLTVCEGSAIEGQTSYAFKYTVDATDYYLGWSTGNNLYAQTAIDANSSWYLSATSVKGTEGNWIISSDGTRNLVYNASSPRFCAYTSNQTSIEIYLVEAAGTPDPVCTHDGATLVEAVAATCTVAGNNAYYYCADCNQYFTDDTFATVTTPEEQAIAPLGHEAGAYVSNNDGTHAVTCTRCDETVSEACTAEMVEEIAATCIAYATTEYECPVCGGSWTVTGTTYGPHNWVDDTCSVCALTRNSYVKVEDPTALTDGEGIVIYYPAGAMLLSGTASGNKLAGVAATVTDATVAANNADELFLIVRIDADGDYYFETLDGKYLTSGETGNSLTLAESLTDYAKWYFDTTGTTATLRIVNRNAFYNGTVAQALEYYNGFTSYSLKDTAAYNFEVYQLEGFSAHTHTWDNGVVSLEPACTTEGVKTFTCESCGETMTEAIPALGHDYSAGDSCANCGLDCVKAQLTAAPADGDTIIIYNPASNVTLTNTPNGFYLNGLAAVDCGSYVMRAAPETVVWTVEVVDADAGTYRFKTADGIYFQSNSFGSFSNSETLPAEGETDYSVWQLIDGMYLTNTGVSKALEYYGGKWQTYSSTNYGTAFELKFFKTNVESFCEHDYVETVVSEASCTTDGVSTFTCSICGDTYTTTVIATGHSYEVTAEVAATCTEDGSKTYTCSVCGDTYTEIIAATGHTDANLDDICDVCGETVVNAAWELSTTEPVAGNKYIIVAHDTTADKWYALTTADVNNAASAGREVLVSNNKLYNPAGDIIFGGRDSTYTTTSTEYTGVGFYEPTAGKCLHLNSSKIRVTTGAQNGVFTFAAGATENTFTMLGTVNNKYLTFADGNFGVSDTAAELYFFYQVCEHDLTYVTGASDPTCTTAGSTGATKCSWCGAELVAATEIPATGHDWVEATEGDNYVAPTCTETGIAFMVCTVCGEVGEGRELPALGHDMVAGTVHAPTCTEDGYTEYACSRCGVTDIDDIVSALGHSYDYTDNGDGTHTVTCANGSETFTEDHVFIDGVCLCGATEITEPTLDSAISIGQQLFLESDLSLTFRIKQSQLTNYDLSTAYLVVERDIYPTGGEVYVKTDTFTEYTIENSRLVFVYSGIAAAQMNDEIRVTLHIKDSSGKDYVSNTLTTSVTAYAKLLFDAYGTSQPSLCTVLMDMLNYGTAAQLYFGRHADAPANTAYAEFANYASYASSDFVTPLEDLSSVITNEGATATMNLSVDLSTRVGIIYKVTLPNGVNAANATVVVKDADGNELETLSLENATVDSKGRYVVTYFGTPSRLMRRVVYGTVYVDGVAISNTYGYSISTYAYQIANTAGMPEALVNLTNLMTMYGDAANAYFGG